MVSMRCPNDMKAMNESHLTSLARAVEMPAFFLSVHSMSGF